MYKYAFPRKTHTQTHGKGLYFQQYKEREHLCDLENGEKQTRVHKSIHYKTMRALSGERAHVTRLRTNTRPRCISLTFLHNQIHLKTYSEAGIHLVLPCRAPFTYTFAPRAEVLYGTD